MITAVEDSTKPAPAMNAVTGDNAKTARQCQQGNRKAHLRQPQPENLSPQRPELLRAQFQPDDEQEHHHAQFREMQDRVGVIEQPQHRWPQQRSGSEIPQHRP